MQEIIIYIKKKKKHRKEICVLVVGGLKKIGLLMQNMEAITMDYLNDADSMYVDSEVTWFWRSPAVTLQIGQTLGWSWWSAGGGGEWGGSRSCSDADQHLSVTDKTE